MSPTGVSVQLYTVRESLEHDVAATLGRLAALGFDQVELFDFVRRADELAAGLAEHGLTGPSAHAMLIGEDLDAVFTAAETIGVRTVVQPMTAPELWSDAAAIARTAADLNEVAAVAADRGLAIGYHNHWWEIENRVDGRSAFDVFVEQLDERVVLEVDTYWVRTGGGSPAELLARLGERVTHIHVKDGPATLEMRDQVALGTGTLDVPAILAAAPRAVRVLELDDCSTDVFDALRDGLAYLASVDKEV